MTYGKETPSLHPDSAASISLRRFGTLELNWLLDRIEDARTGSVGVRHAAMVSAVATSSLNSKAAKRAQMSHEKVITIARSEVSFLMAIWEALVKSMCFGSCMA